MSSNSGAIVKAACELLDKIESLGLEQQQKLRLQTAMQNLQRAVEQSGAPESVSGEFVSLPVLPSQSELRMAQATRLNPEWDAIQCFQAQYMGLQRAVSTLRGQQQRLEP